MLLLHAVFLLGLFFGPEHGADMFLRNFGSLQQIILRYILEYSNVNLSLCLIN
jgi:hypothetical protein